MIEFVGTEVVVEVEDGAPMASEIVLDVLGLLSLLTAMIAMRLVLIGGIRDTTSTTTTTTTNRVPAQRLVC